MAFNNEASQGLHSFSSTDLQVLYDWVGQETSQEYFTLHQFGSRFFFRCKATQQQSPPIRKQG